MYFWSSRVIWIQYLPFSTTRIYRGLFSMQCLMCSEDNESGSRGLVDGLGGMTGGRDRRSSWGEVSARSVLGGGGVPPIKNKRTHQYNTELYLCSICKPKITKWQWSRYTIFWDIDEDIKTIKNVTWRDFLKFFVLKGFSWVLYIPTISHFVL